jgi:hypothetical protein
MAPIWVLYGDLRPNRTTSETDAQAQRNCGLFKMYILRKMYSGLYMMSILRAGHRKKSTNWDMRPKIGFLTQ